MHYKFKSALRFPGKNFLQYGALAGNAALVAIHYFHDSAEVFHSFHDGQHFADLFDSELYLLFVIPLFVK